MTTHIWQVGPYGVLNESDEVYHKNPAISKSKLDDFIFAPRYYYKKHVARNLIEPQESREARWKVIGNAIDARLFLGERAYAERYIVRPDFGDKRKPENKARQSAWELTAGTRIPVEEDEAQVLDAMAVACRQHPLISEILARTKPQVVFRAKGADGFDLQCKCDGLIESVDAELAKLLNESELFPDTIQAGDTLVVDGKSTTTFDEGTFSSWGKQVTNLGYHRQAAMYRGVMRSVKEFPRLHWAFIAYEKAEPFEAGLFVPDPDMMTVGWTEVVGALTRLKECIATGVWPSRVGKGGKLSMPAYYRR
jgi:hypothetical protein